MTVLPMCTELTAPKDEQLVVVTYMAPAIDPTVGAAILEVGDKVPVSAQVTVNGTAQPRARFTIRSLNNRVDVVRVDSLNANLLDVKGRGTDTLVVSVVGATIGVGLSNSTADTVIVIGKPAKNVINANPAKATLTFLQDTVYLNAVSTGKNDEEIKNGRVDWSMSSADSARVRITQTTLGGETANTVLVTALTPGTATIRAVFEGVDTVTHVVNVVQEVKGYTFAVAPVTPGAPVGPTVTQVKLTSKNDSIRVVATPVDSGKSPILVNPPVPVYTTDAASGLITLDANTGVLSALQETPGVNVRVAGFTNALQVIVEQVATSIVITGSRTVNIPAPGTDTTLSAVATDARGNNTSTAKFSWSSSNQTVAQVEETSGKVATLAVGTAQIVVRRDGAADSVTLAVTNNPTSLVATPAALTIRSLTDTARATATFFNARGNQITGTAAWTSLTPAVATVDQTGLVTAAAVGTANIVAATTVGVGADTIQVTVTNNPTTVAIIPPTVTIASIGDTLSPQVPVDFRNSLGTTLPRNAVTWETRDQTIARPTLDGLGNIVAVAKGETQIIARSPDGSAADTVGVIVTNAPASVVMNRTNDNLSALSLTLQYSADVFNGRGALITGQQLVNEPVTWRSTNGAVASISTAGVATALSVGTTQIIAEIGGSTTGLRADTATLTVSNSAVAMTVTPSAQSITSVGSTFQLSASATNNAGGVVAGQTFNWATSDAAVATVSATGLVTATGTGTATITASIPSSTLSATSTITVTNLPTTIVINEDATTLASVNDTFTPTVDFRNAANTALAITSATWTSDDPLIATVGSNGLITAKAPGTTKVRAANPSNAAIRDSITVTVSNAASSMTLSPAGNQTLTSFGQTLTLTATVTNAAGQPISNPTVTWEVVTDSTVVTAVTSGVATGLITAVANGTRTVRVTSGTVVRTFDVIVAQAVSPTQSTVTASPTSITADGSSTSTITVQLKDGSGNNYVLNNPVMTITPSAGSLGAITNNGSGNYTAALTSSVTSGPSTVTVAAGAVSLNNTAIVTFSPGAATQYLVTSSSSTPVAGNNVTITAQLKDVNNNNVGTAGRVITWSSTGGGSFASPTSTTNASGVATVVFTTAATSATHFVTATDASSLLGTTAAINTVSGSATKYVLSPSTGTSVAAGGSVTITAQLTDVNSVPVGTAGHVVTWSSNNGGSFSAATSTTNASGVATVSFTPAGTAGTVATVTGTDGNARTGSTSTITTTAGTASQLSITTSPTAAPQSGVAFPTQPVIQLRDGSGNTVATANVSVTASISAGSGTLGGITTVQTNGSGVATFSNLSVSGTTGAQTIAFTSSGLTAASAGVTLAAGPASQMALNAGNAQTAAVSATVGTAPSVVVRDAAGNAVAGVSVTFTVTGGGGSTNPASGSTVATDGSGIASLTSWTLGSTAGTNTLTATVAGLTGSPVTFTATGTAGAAATIAISAGNTQTAVAGSAVAVAPSVLVTDASGNPKAGVNVTFAIGSGGGSFSSPSGATVATNSSGIAALNSWVLGATAGANTLTATSAGLTNSPLTFTATGTAGTATQIALNAGNNQSATVGTAVGTAPQVLVRDVNGNPVNNVAVTFTVTGGGGSTNPASGGTVNTNASGLATLTSWTLGTSAGTNTLTAAVSGLTGSPVTFTATGTASAATTIASNAGGGETVTAGSAVATAPSVLVTDASGNPKSGVAVTFAVTAGGGSISSPTGAVVTTNASGIAALSSWILGTTAGANTVTATAAGLAGSPVSFSATGTAGAATQIALNAGNNQSATIGTAVGTAPQVLVRDVNGNPVNGVAVTFSVTGGGGSTNPASGGTVNTNASGLATLTSWTLGTTAGTNTLTAAVSGLSGSPVTFTATGTAGAATTLTLVTGDGQSATVGTAVAIAPSVRVTDASGNPKSGVSVTFAVATGGGSISSPSGATMTTDASGLATLSTWTLGPIAGSNTITATSAGLTNSPITFTATGTANAGAQYAVYTGNGQSATVGTAVTTAPAVIVRDANGNPVSGTTIIFTATDGTILPATASTTGVATDASGIATLTSWTLKTTAGANALTATVSGGPLNGTAVTFTATGTAAAAATIASNAGGGETVPVGTAVVTAPSVLVTDASGNPKSGVVVTFAVTAGGGSISSPTGVSVTTNASGIAALSTWIVGTSAGTNTVTATAAGLAGSPVSFSATATASAATQIALSTGNNQNATVGTAVATPPRVLVRDANNNPVSGVAVTFTVTGGGGSTNPASGGTVNTDASGLAALTSWTLGTTSGTNTVAATVSGLAGSPVTFTATAIAGVTTAAQSTVARTGSNNIVADGVASSTIVVTAKDANGNPVSGKTISLDDGAASSTISPASGTSDASGQVTFTVTNTIAEAATYTATVTDGAAVVVTQQATVTFVVGTVSAAQSTVSASASPITADGATTSTITVTLKDAQGNAVAGKTVSLARTGSTSAISAPSGASNASGVVTFTVTNTTAETVTYTATANDPGAIAITQTAAVVFQAGTETNSVALTSQSQTATVDGTVTAPSVRVRDAQNNPVAGVTVTFTLVSSGVGGQIDGGTAAVPVVTNASGVASLTSWKLGPTAGANTVTASTTNAGSVVFTATGTAGTATTIAASGTPSTSATVGTAVATPPAVLVSDANGNPVSGKSVVFTLTAPGGTGGAIAPVSPATVVTGSNGIATLTSWTLGQTAGTNNNTVTATTTGIGTTVTFNASGNAGAAQNIIANSVTSQSATVGTTATAPSVIVRDAYNNPVSGIAVTFTTTAGTGTLDPVSGSTVTTNGSGVATLTSWTLGSAAGTNTVQASFGTLSGSPVTFNATGTAAVTTAAQSTVAVSGSATVVADGAASTTIVVTAKDASGNPVAGKSISLDDADASAAISPASGTSNASGQVTFTVTNTQAEAITYTATVTDGGAVVVTQQATVTFVVGTVSAAQSTVSASASPITADGATTSTITVTLKDAQGNAVSGKTVSLARTGSTSVISAPSGSSNGSGVVTFTVTNTTAETVTYTATANDPGAIAITQTASVVFEAGGANNTVALTSQSQTGTIETAVTAPSVRVRDAQNNPVAGVNVTFTLTSDATGGLIDGGTAAVVVATNASGVASLTSWTLGQVAGTNNNVVTVTAAGVGGSVVFNASGTAGTATTIAASGTPSTSATVGTAVATPPAVLVTDTRGNPVSGKSVVFTLTAPGGTGGAIAPVSPATVVTGSNGIATLTSWTLGQTAGTNNNTVTATTTGIGTTVTFNASGNAGAAQNIIANSVTSQSATVGTTATAPSVIVRDAYNNPVSGIAVTFTTTAGAGTLDPVSGSTVTTNGSGVATLTSWTLGSAAGTNTVQASFGTLSGSPVTFNATGTAAVTTAAQSTVVRTGATNVPADGISTSTVVVTAKDASGNVVAGKSISLDDGGASSTISPASGTSDASGQVTFTVKNTVAEAVTYTATVTDGGAVVVTQQATVTFIGGTNYLVTAASSSVTAGTNVVITAQLRDASNNPVAQSGKTVVWSKACNAGACAGGATGGSFATPTSLTDANGRATVALTVSSDASISMTVTATDNEALVGTSGSIDVLAAAPHHLAVVAQPTNTVAGVAVSPAVQVEVQDSFNNAVTTDPNGAQTETITVSLTAAGGATLGGTKVVNVNWATGRAAFSDLTVDKVATYTLTATDQNMPSNLADAVSSSFDITHAAASQLVVTTQPSASTVAGVAFAQQPVVTVRDQFGNTVTTGADATVTITASLTTGTGTLSGTLTKAAVAGVADFSGNNLSIDLAGTDKVLTLATTIGAGAVSTTTSPAFTITHAAASQLAVTTQPSASTVAGVAFAQQPVVTVRDQFGNTVTTGADATVTITASLTTGSGTLSGTLTKAAVAGVADFSGNNLSIELAGTDKVLTLATSLAGPGAVSTTTAPAFTITHAAASQLAVTTQPSASTAATVAFAQQPVVTVRDQFGNTVTTGADATVTITASLTTGTGTLSGTLTKAAVAGVADFSGNNLSIDKAGTDKVLTLATSLSGPGAVSTTTSPAFTITVGPATQLVVTTQPSASTVAGIAFAQQPIVQVQDAGGNLVTTGGDATVTVTASLTTGSGTLSGTLTKAAVGGIADFSGNNLSIDLAGTDKVLTLATSLAGPGAVSTTTAPAFTITHAAASQLAVTTQPSASTVAGVAFAQQPVVTVRDQFGNTVTTGADATVTITASLTTGSGTLSGTLTKAAVAGVADFSGNNLSIDLVGTDKVLTMATTIGAGAVSTTTSPAFTITHAAASQLAVTTQPSASTVAGVAFAQQPIVTVQDQFGNTVTTGADATVTITASLTTGSGTLSGTLTKAAVAGVADFSGNNLSIDLVGTDKVLTMATSLTGPGAVSTTTSPAFTITAADLNGFVVETDGGGAIADQTSGNPFAIQVRAVDQFGNTVTSYSGAGQNVSITASNGDVTVSSGSPTADFTNGVLTGASITLTAGTPPQTTTITVAGGGKQGTSNSFAVQ